MAITLKEMGNKNQTQGSSNNIKRQGIWQNIVKLTTEEPRAPEPVETVSCFASNISS